MFRFALRNPSFFLSSNNIRELPDVRNAMDDVRKAVRYCEFCFSTERGLQVHHSANVANFPNLAADRDLMCVLCPKCHLSCGHFNDYKKRNKFILKVINDMFDCRLFIDKQQLLVRPSYLIETGDAAIPFKRKWCVSWNQHSPS